MSSPNPKAGSGGPASASDDASGFWKVVGSVSTTLAEGVKTSPALSAICLVMLVLGIGIAWVAIQTSNGTYGVASLVVLAITAVIAIVVTSRRAPIAGPDVAKETPTLKRIEDIVGPIPKKEDQKDPGARSDPGPRSS